VRLAIWNALVLLAMFSLAGGGVWLAIRNSIHESVDEDLGERLVLLKGEVERALADAGEAGLPDRLARETATGQGARFRLSNGERWIYQSAGAERWPGLPTLPPALDANGLTQTLFVNDRPVRVLTARETFDGTPWLVEIGVPMGEFYSAFRHIAWALGLASPAVLIIAALGGYWMSVWALRPVGQVTQTARAIGAENLTERLPLLGTGDEIDRLSETLNDMFGRLDVAFRRVTQFTADASHELRTPTAIIRTTAEIARRRPRHHDEYEEALDRILVESERMTTLIDDLLLLARSDADRHEFVF
jgi:signal transduction histidine kinase